MAPAWAQAAERLGAFARARGHWPDAHSKNPGEVHLAAFLAAQRARLLRAVPSDPDARRKRAHLTGVAPGWDAGTMFAAATRPAEHNTPTPEAPSFTDRLMALVAFRQDTDRWPRHTGYPCEETDLAAWLAGLDTRSLPQARARLLNRLAPGWRAPVNRRTLDYWQRRAARVAQFITDHGRHPALEAPHRAEYTLAAFLAEARKRARVGSLTDDQLQVLSEHVPSWAGTAYEFRWYQRAEHLADFYRQHLRHPRRHGTAPDEHTMFLFVRHQRATLRGVRAGTLVKERRQVWLDEHIPGWDDGRTPPRISAAAGKAQQVRAA